MGLGGGQEHGQRRTGDQAAVHAVFAMCLMDPEPAQEKGEDQLGHEERLDDRELSGCGVRPPGIRTRLRPPTHPRSQRGWRMRNDEELPATVLRAQTSAGGVLCHQVHRVGQGRGQGEDDRDDHAVDSGRAGHPAR